MTSLQNSKSRELKETPLREALGRYAPIALCLVDNEFRIRHCNDFFLELLDVKYDDCLEKAIADYIPELTPQFFTEIVKSVKKKSSKIKSSLPSRFSFRKRKCLLNIRIITDCISETSLLLLSIQIEEMTAAEADAGFEKNMAAFSGLRSEVVLVWDANMSNTLYVNDAFETVWKMDKETVLKEPLSWLGRVFAEDLKTLVPMIQEKSPSGLYSEFGHQFRLVWPDGNIRWVWACFGLSANMVVSTIRDISEEKRNLTLGKRVLESMPTLNYIFDIEEKKTSYRGGKGYELLGYTSESIAKAPDDFFVSIMNPTDLAQWSNVIEKWKAVKDGEVLKTEFRLRDAQGSWRWFLSADTVYSRTLEGTVKEVIGTAQEITDRKNMEEERRKSDERFRRYFEQGLVGIAVTSLQKGWLEVNDYICQMLDYSREELKRRTWDQLTYPEDLPADLESFERLLSGEIESYTLDKRFLKKDGTPVYASIAVSCVRDNLGQPDHIVLLIQDISGRKGAERELSQYRDHLEELVKARTAELYAANEKLRQEIRERREVEETLQKKNIALNEILGQIEIEKKGVRDQIMANVERLLLPTIKKLSVEDRELRQDYIALLVRNLKEMTSSFGANITSKYYKLTPREIEICNMIKSRLSNKEISKLLNISLRTVETHRNDIRKKLNLSHKNVNLATYLQGM